ncbi:MAG: hypothetical protein ACLFNU_10365, partial [Bacteroidales bacterium]
MKAYIPSFKMKTYSRALVFLLLITPVLGFSQTNVFSDDFSTWQGWNTYESGNVEYSSNQSFIGSYSLRKTTNNDPDGGYKLLDAPINREFTFTGRIFRPSTASGGVQDRLAISNGNFDGYGFRLSETQLGIEKRTAGEGTDISTLVNITGDRPEDEWYRFEFTSNADNTFTVTIFDEGGSQLATVTSSSDTDFNLFDRVVIHGGYDYYVDNIQVDADNPIITTPRLAGPGGVGNSDGSDDQPALQMWLDATTLAYNNNDPVSVWSDVSGNANNATQPTADEQPLFQTSQINGNPTVSFDGSDDFLFLNGSMITNTDYTVMSVASRRSSGSRKIIVGGDNTGTDNNLHIYWENEANYRTHHYGNDVSTSMVSTAEAYSGGTQANEYGFFASVLNSDLTSEERRHYQNNFLLGTENRTGQLNSWSGAAIARYTPSNNYDDIDVAEMLMYSSGLNDAQVAIISNYQSIKYGIAIAGVNYTPGDAAYIHDFVGIGSSDGTQKHTKTANSGGGIFLRESNGSLDESNEYVFAAHANQSVGETTNDLPALSEGSLISRTQRIWYIDRTEATTTSASIGFDLNQIGLGEGSDNQIFHLLYRNTTSGDFSTISGAIGIVSGGFVWFSVDNDDLLDGYYTIARSDQTGRTWYSYQTGDWDDYQTWSLESGGGDIVNPNDETPTTSATAGIDKVVVLYPYRVTVSADNKQNAILEVRDGELDFGTTTGHNFSSIQGQGTILLNTDNFPEGEASDFNGENGGTVEYYGTGHNLTTARTFNNMKVNLTNSADELIMLKDYTLHGNLTVENGIFSINDNTSTTVLELDIAKNIDVNTNGQIVVGSGNTIGSYSISGNMPALGEYHNIFHQVRVGGDLTNNGSIRFTNQGAPDYAQFTSNGAATVTFYGSTNNTAELYGTTDFYNLIINKGVDRTFELKVYTEDTDHFQIYGPNNVGRRTGGSFTAENPEVRKSLWIRNGTLRLTGEIVLPSLSEGNQAGGNGDYPIPGKGRLWIDGENVRVYSTAQNGSAELLPGTSGVNNGSSNQALSVYGEFRISDGYFNTRNSAGFIFWPQASAVINIEGGLSDVAQFRSSHTGGGGKTSFIMSGGHLMIRGNRQFTYDFEGTLGSQQINPDGGGEITGAYPTFGIVDPDGVFQMTGGNIYVADESGNNDFESNAICIQSDETNHNVTGGTFYVLMNNNNNYDIISNGPLYNLEVDKLSGTGTASLHMGSDLWLKGGLYIRDYSRLISRRQHGNFRYAVRDLTVDRAFLVETQGDYLPYSNTTTLRVTYSTNTVLRHANQQFFNLILKNNPDFTSDSRLLSGNTNAVTIHNNLTIESGTVFTHSDKDILVKGNVFNSGTIQTTGSGNVILTDRGIVTSITLDNPGSHTSIPSISFSGGGGAGAEAIPIFNGVPAAGNALPLIGIAVTNSGTGYTSAPTVTVSSGGATVTAVINTQHELGGDGNGVFGNLEVDEAHPSEAGGREDITFLAANQRVSNTLTLTDGVFDLRNFNLTHEGALSSETISDYTPTQMLRTNGNHSDGGYSRKVSGNNTYLFPLGIYTTTGDGSRYTPATQEFSSFVDEGYSRINNVDYELPTLAESGNSALQYYWRLRSNGFTNVPNVINRFYFYNMPEAYSDGAGNPSSWEPGKIVNLVRKYDLGDLDWDNPTDRLLMTFTHQDDNTTGATPPPLEEGEFTTGHSNLFAGSVKIFFSRLRGTSGGQRLWGETGSWTTLAQLYSVHGPNVLDNPELWHRSDNPASNDGTPTSGDIVIIGWVPWDDPQTAYRGDPHNIRQNGGTISCAELKFNPMLTEEGDPAPRKYWDSYFFRPTLSLSDGAIINTPIISGEGTIRNRNNDPDFSGIDLGDFVAQDSSYMLYEIFGNVTLNNIPTELPNLMIVPDGWGGNARTATIPIDVVVNNNLEIHGAGLLQLNNGAQGDIYIKGDLRLLRATRESTTYTNTHFFFQNNGTPRDVTVEGNIYTEGTAGIYIDSPNTTIVQHSLNLHGSYTQDATASVLGGDQPILRLGTAQDQDRVALNLLGTSNALFSGSNLTTSMELYSLLVNKGATSTPTVTINNNFTLNGPTDGTRDEKALLLQNGSLVLNHPDIDINLSTGGDDFRIKSSTRLHVQQGIARVNAPGSNGIFLDGRLDVGDGASRAYVILEGGSDNYIHYSSSGNAEIRVLGNGELEVGSQVRSSTENNLGVLKFLQSGGNSPLTKVGVLGAPEGLRGLFEVYNPGSSFQLYSGTLMVSRPHDGAATRAALYLDAATVGVNRWGNVQIGDPANPVGGNITVNSTGSIPSFIVDGNATAKLDVNHLYVRGHVTIESGAAIDGSSLNLSLENDFINSGQESLNLDSLAFVGDSQTVEGDLSADNILIEPTTDVTVQGATTLTALKDLILQNGTLSHGNQDINVEGDVYNIATHNSTGTGNLVLNGTDLQMLGGTGQYGRIEIDKSSNQARLSNSISLNQDITLTDGILNIEGFNLSLSQNTNIQGTGFGTDKMIITDGGFGDLGISKSIGTGAQSFTFPMGVISGEATKYTPIDFDITANASVGSISVHPVDQEHMTVECGDVLQYYWIMNSTGISGMDATIDFHFDPADVVGDPADYYRARLVGDEWSKSAQDAGAGEDEIVQEDRIEFSFSGVDDIGGDYTAGADVCIPDNVPIYYTVQSGNWSNADIWAKEGGGSVPSGGPQGHIVRISSGHTITMDRFRIRSYRTVITGRLEVGTETGHHLGFVSGTGTLAMQSEKLYPGNYSEFLACGTGGTMEFGGAGTYNLPPIYQYNNLTVTGSGTKTMPNEDMTICGDLRIKGNVTLKQPSVSTGYRYTDIEGDVFLVDNATWDHALRVWVKLKGDLIKASTADNNFAYTYQTIEIIGTENQIIEGDYTGPNRFNNFYFRNPNIVEYNGPSDIGTFMYLFNGRVVTTKTNIVTITRATSAGNGFINYSNGLFEGPVKINLNSSSPNKFLPVGKNNIKKFIYPLDLPSTVGYWTGEYFNTSPTGEGMS